MLFWLLKRSILGSFLVLIVAVSLSYYNEHQQKLNSEKLEAWAEANRIKLTKENSVVSEFKATFDQNEWDLLVSKLEKSRYFETLDQKYAQYNEFGFNPDNSKDFVEYWKKGYDWKKRIDEHLNQFPQYRLVHDGVTIHFVHVTTNPQSMHKRESFSLYPFIIRKTHFH